MAWLVSDLPDLGSLFRQLAGRVKHQYLSQVTSLQADSAYKPTCLKFNKNDRKCPFGARSHYMHLLTITKQLRHDCSATVIMN